MEAGCGIDEGGPSEALAATASRARAPPARAATTLAAIPEGDPPDDIAAFDGSCSLAAAPTVAATESGFGIDYDTPFNLTAADGSDHGQGGDGEISRTAPLIAATATVSETAAPGLATQQSSRCLLYTSPSPRDKRQSRMPSSA